MIGIHAAFLFFVGRFTSAVHRAYTLFFIIGTRMTAAAAQQQEQPSTCHHPQQQRSNTAAAQQHLQHSSAATATAELPPHPTHIHPAILHTTTQAPWERSACLPSG